MLDQFKTSEAVLVKVSKVLIDNHQQNLSEGDIYIKNYSSKSTHQNNAFKYVTR